MGRGAREAAQGICRVIDSVFNALADPTRRQMVERLSRNGPMTTGALIEDLGMSRQGAARHLDVLESSGLVVSSKQGRIVMRELDVSLFGESMRWMNTIAASWDARFSRLREGYSREEA